MSGGESLRPFFSQKPASDSDDSASQQFISIGLDLSMGGKDVFLR